MSRSVPRVHRVKVGEKYLLAQFEDNLGIQHKNIELATQGLYLTERPPPSPESSEMPPENAARLTA